MRVYVCVFVHSPGSDTRPWGVLDHWRLCACCSGKPATQTGSLRRFSSPTDIPPPPESGTVITLRLISHRSSQMCEPVLSFQGGGGGEFLSISDRNSLIEIHVNFYQSAAFSQDTAPRSPPINFHLLLFFNVWFVHICSQISVTFHKAAHLSSVHINFCLEETETVNVSLEFTKNVWRLLTKWNSFPNRMFIVVL